MLVPASLSLLLGGASLFHVAHGAPAAHVAPRDGASPGLTYDPNTSSYCTWWVDVTTAKPCAPVLLQNAVTLEQFRRWNPSIPASCETLQAGHSYCIEALWEPDPTSGSTTTTTQSTTTSQTTTTQTTTTTTTTTKTTTTSQTTTTSKTTTTTASTTTTTTPNNGVATPSPIQSGMVANCNKFHWVEKGQSCAVIAALYSISAAQFAQWNPASKPDCSNLWALTYACVSIIGLTPSPTPTKTEPLNGIPTPTPTHPGMTPNCNKFVKVNPGDTCDGIAFFNGPIATENFVLWNTGVGGRECRTLQAGTYACVGLIPGMTPTQPWNGIVTPSPAQQGLVGNCNRFVKVKEGDTCDGIAFWNGVAGTEWVKRWNEGVGEDCRGLQVGAYVCVGVVG